MPVTPWRCLPVLVVLLIALACVAVVAAATAWFLLGAG